MLNKKSNYFFDNKNKGKKKFFGQPTAQDKRFLIAGGGLILVLSAAIIAARHFDRASVPDETVVEETTTEAVPLQVGTTINGISVDGMTRDEAKQAVLKKYPWKMTVTYGEDSEQVANLVEQGLDKLLDEVCAATEGKAYTLDLSTLKPEADAEAKRIASKWDVKAENGRLDGYDSATGEFTFSSAVSGMEIDQSALSADIMKALEAGNYSAQIKASGHETPAGESQKSKYKTVAIFTTETTDNPKRNKNVKLAADALNGTIVMPGEEFSFNEAIGERTAEKGYQEAAAYNSGEVVQEVGGGVCQISSTLYRVAFQAGMKITFRRSHTFEPNYVTPGQDATISWEEPDFRFVNTSSEPIGIRASYADRKATVAIFGVPVLEDGVTWDLYSEKVEDTDIPEPTYIEDQTLKPGVEKVQKAGSKGSTWVTYKIVYKDGKEVERVKDHEKTYKGHAPVIRRNTSGVVLSPSETKTQPTETPSPTVDGMPDTYVPGKESVPPESSAAETSGKSSGTSAETKGTSAETAAKPTSAEKETTAKETTAAPKETTAAPSTAPATEAAPEATAGTEAPTAEVGDSPVIAQP